MIKVLLVISEVTYVPGNCLEYLNQVLEKNRGSIAGVVILNNFSPAYLLNIIWLYILHCNNFANTLLRNVAELPLKKEKRYAKKKKSLSYGQQL
jgi:hypothetical protein